MVYVLLGTGFEEMEAIAPIDLMRRAGIDVKTVGVTGKTVYGSHGIGVEADILPEEMDLDAMARSMLEKTVQLSQAGFDTDTLRASAADEQEVDRQ